MPQRTRSKWDEGRRIVAAELARWVTSGSSPAVSARASASRKAASWASLAGWAGSSLAAKWDQIPVTVIRPCRSRSLATSKRGFHSERGAPPRKRPVSTLSCTRAGPTAAISSSSVTE